MTLKKSLVQITVTNHLVIHSSNTLCGQVTAILHQDVTSQIFRLQNFQIKKRTTCCHSKLKVLIFEVSFTTLSGQLGRIKALTQG